MEIKNVTRLCRRCGNDFRAYASLTSHFCSLSCQNAKENNPNWKGGDSRDETKVRVRNKARAAIKSGQLIKQPCEKCGTTERIEAHHDDYSKPLDVRWLCATCHRKYHAKLNGHRALVKREPSRHKWTDADLTYIVEHQNNMTYLEIATALRVSLKSLDRAVDRYGLRKHSRKQTAAA